MVTKQTDRWFDYVPFILVLAGPLILFGPALVRAEALYWGLPSLQFVPWRTFALEVIRQGDFPLWNPYLGMGAPLFANYQAALLYPPNLLLLVTPIALGQTLLVMAHLIWAGLGMVILCRKMGFKVLAQVVAGLGFGLSGYLVARAGFISMNAAGAWLPWILLAVWNLVACMNPNSKRNQQLIGSMVMLAIALSMQWFAGHAQISWYSGIFAFAWACWLSYKQAGLGGIKWVIPRLLPAAVVGIGLTAVQLLPTLEYLLNSFRSGGVDPDLAMTYSFWPWRFAELIAPGLYGNPATGNYWGYGNYWEDAIFIGLPGFVLAVFGLLKPGKKHASLRNFLLLVSVGAVILALGKNTPVFPFLYQRVPSFDFFQAPTRWSILLVFSLSMLAAVGADRWQAPSGRGLYWTRLATAGFAALLITSLLARGVLEEIQPTFAPSLAATGFWLFLLGILALLASAYGSSNYWQLGVAFVILLNLIWYGKDLNPTVKLDFFVGASEINQRVEQDQRIFMPPEIEYDLIFNQYFRFDDFQVERRYHNPREVGLANMTLLDGYSSANNFDPFLPETYLRWIRQLESLPSEARERRLAFMDVSQVATISRGERRSIEYLDVPDPQRIWLVHQAIWVEDNDAAFQAMEDPEFALGDTVLLEGSADVGRVSVAGKAELLQFNEPSVSRTDLTIRSTDGIWVVISDTFFPGWKASLDGDPTRIFRANGTFRGVWVPAGTHQIVMQYTPIWFLIGCVISIFCWSVLLALGFRWII